MDAFAKLDGVRAVALRARGGGVEVDGPDGRIVAPGGGGEASVEGRSPLEGTIDEAEALSDLVGLLSHPDSGDLVVLAGRLSVPGRRKVYLNFQHQFGAHGGLEPQEQYAFIMGPPGMRGVVEGTTSPEDLYDVLMGGRGSRARAGGK